MKIIVLVLILLIVLSIALLFTPVEKEETLVKEYEVVEGFAMQDLETGVITLADNSKIVEVKG